MGRCKHTHTHTNIWQILQEKDFQGVVFPSPTPGEKKTNVKSEVSHSHTPLESPKVSGLNPERGQREAWGEGGRARAAGWATRWKGRAGRGIGVGRPAAPEAGASGEWAEVRAPGRAGEARRHPCL